MLSIASSSGIGRPGVFIALRSLQEESEIEGQVNIFQTVQKLRQQRASIIQTRVSSAFLLRSRFILIGLPVFVAHASMVQVKL